MMLDHIGEKETSSRIQAAIASVVEEGKVRTYDMMKMPGREDVLKRGAAGTREMAGAIIKKLK